MLLLILVISTVSATIADSLTYQNFAKANNRFTPDIYKQIAPAENGNVIMSPLSAETVLALLLSGCKGATSQQLSSALHLSNDSNQVRTEVRSLLIDLQSENGLTFNIANGVFLQQNFKIRESFRNVASNDFQAKIENLDFAQNTVAANTINQFVEDETNKTIKNLVAPSSLSEATKLVLVNALHFKGNWSVQFSVSETSKKPFYRTETDVAQVDTLHLNRKHFNYYENNNAQFLELMFKGGASMVFVVPKNGLANLEKNLCFFKSAVPFKSTYLNVQIPKFKFDYKIDFKKVLESLGVTKIFNSNEGDLSGIAEDPGYLIVSEVFQKAFIDLNEGGVEAAAATYVGVEATAVLADSPKDFKADRPFIFYIKYKGIVTFAGKVTNPKY